MRVRFAPRAGWAKRGRPLDAVVGRSRPEAPEIPLLEGNTPSIAVADTYSQSLLERLRQALVGRF